MKMLIRVALPVARANAAVKDGTMQRVIKTFLEEAKPESVIFTVKDGRRTMVAIADMPSAQAMPKWFEPVFQELEAEVELTPGMGPHELAAGLAEAGF